MYIKVTFGMEMKICPLTRSLKWKEVPNYYHKKAALDFAYGPKKLCKSGIFRFSCSQWLTILEGRVGHELQGSWPRSGVDAEGVSEDGTDFLRHVLL